MSLETYNCFGHDDMIPTVWRLLERLKAGSGVQRGAVIGVSGGPGTGKTHLVSALCRHFALKPCKFDPLRVYCLPKCGQLMAITAQFEDGEYDALVIDDYDLITDEKHKVVIEDFLCGRDGLVYKKPLLVFFISCHFDSVLVDKFDVHLQVSLSCLAREHILRAMGYIDSHMSVTELAGMLNGYNYYNIRDLLKQRTSDIIQYIRTNKPTVVREMCEDDGVLVSMDYSTYTLEQLGGIEDVIRELEDRLVKPFQERLKFERHQIAMPTGVLLYGPSGTGKTHLAIATARHHHQHLSFLHVNAAGLRSKYLGDTEKRIASVFQRARSMAPCIIFLDHIDHLLVSRSDGGDGDSQDQRIVTAFLVELDGAVSRPGDVVVLAVATCKDAIDKAILRPGRLGHHIHMQYFDKAEQVVAMVKVILQQLHHNLQEDDIKAIASRCMGMSQAEIRGVVLRAARRAIYDQQRPLDPSDFTV